jgi:H+-transporting ATPase
VPFDPIHKRTEATITGPDGKTFRVAKGAPQVILALCQPCSADLEEKVDAAVDDYAV